MKNRILRVLLLLFMAAGTSHAQVLTRAEYFVDADPGVGLATPLTISPGDTVLKDFSFSTSGLPPGYHLIIVRTRDAVGRWGVVMTTSFYIYGIQPQPVISPRYFPITKAEYFFDTDPGQGMGTSLPLIRGDTVDATRYLRVNGLDTGYHYLYIRAMGENNLWGLAQRAKFHVDTSTCNMPVANFTFDTVNSGSPCHFTNLSTNITGGTQYKWDINNDGTIEYTTQNINYTFAVPGYYKVKLIVENSPTCKTMILRDVVTGPMPSTVVLIAGATTFCKGDSAVLTSNNYAAGTTFDWSTGATTRAITVKSSGDYFCWIKNSAGISRRSATVHIQVNEVPLVNLTYHNATGGAANGSAWVDVSGSTGSYTYRWSNGVTVSCLKGLATGNYSVTVSNGSCPVIKSFTIVNQASAAGNISGAEYYFDTDPGIGNGTPVITWASDTVDFLTIVSFPELTRGYHYLYFRTRDTYGRWSIDKSAVVYIREPDVNPPLVVQPQVTKAEYFINTDPGAGNGVNIPVTAGDEVTKDFTIPTTGFTTGFYNLYVRARDASGKWSIYARSPIYIYDNQRSDLSKKYKSIAGAEYFFDSDPGIGNGTKIKSNIYDTIDLTRDIRTAGLNPGSHYLYLRAYDDKGFTGLWQRTSFLVRYVTCTCPVVDFSVDTVRVLGNPTHFVNLSSSIAPAATYQWDVNGDGAIDYTTANVNHTYAAYGLYNARLTVKNADSCYASITKQIVVSPVIDTTLTITGALTFCEGGSVQLSAQSGYKYYWSNDETTRTIVVNQSGDYAVRLTNTYGVQAFSRIVHVVVYPLPVVQIVTINASGGAANGTAICNATGGTGNYTYHWSTGSALSIINNLSAGTYSVTISDGRCPVIRSFTIGNDPVNAGDIVGAEYFFDTEPGVGSGIPMNIAGGDTVFYATCMPMGSLSPGFHNIYIRVRDTYGRWSLILNNQFYIYTVSPVTIGSQPSIVKAEYFLNADPGPRNGNPVSLTKGDEVTKDFTALTTGLPIGFHNLSVRAMDSLGKWSISDAEKIYIYAVPGILPAVVQPKIIAAEYFYDTDPGQGYATAIPFSPTGDSITMDRFLPVTGLTVGTHYVYLRTRDEGGKWGIASRLSFTVKNTLCITPTTDFTIGTAVAGSPVTFTNTSGNLAGGVTYQWDINNDGTIEYTSKNITRTFALSGNYDVKLTVINSDTCKASILKQVIVGPLPPATLTVTGNTSLCQGDSVKLQVSAGYLYKWWPTGQTTQSIWAKTTGTYYCWLRTITGLEVKSQVVVVTSYPRPSVTVNKTDASGGKNNGSAWVEVSGGSGTYSYLWSSGATTMFANSLSPGSYTVQVSDGHCPVVKSITIGTHAVAPENILTAEYFFDTDPGAGLGTPINIAASDTVDYFTGCSVSGLTPGYHYVFIRVMDTFHRWSMHRQEEFYVHAIPAPVPVTNQPPLTSSEYFVDLNIDSRPDPGIGMGTTVAVTPGDLVEVDYSYTVDTLLLGFHYISTRTKDQGRKWSHSMSESFFVYDTTRRNAETFQPPLLAVEYFLDTDPGVGNGIPFTVTPGDEVTWNGGIPTTSISLGAHNLYIRAKDSGKKWGLYKKVSFTIFPCTQPHANFSFVQTCITTPIQFTDLSTSVDPAATYAWDVNNDGIVDYTTRGSISHQYTIPGVYQCKLKITHNTACVDSIIKTVVFPFVRLPADTTIYTNQSIVLDGGSGYTYLWNTGATTQTITVNGATAGIGLHNYSVVVTNGMACTATDNINITVTLPPRDLIVLSASMFHDTIQASGDSADMRCVIKNTGTISSTASVVQYYLSADSLKSVSDQYIGSGAVSALAAGASVSVLTRQFVPAGSSGQIWYILFVADGTGIVVESNEGNNIKPVPFLYSTGGVPTTLSVLDQTVSSGQVRCYNAFETITVAGAGSSFQVLTGGSATFIAGSKIRYLPGTKVFSGGYMRGYITTNGQYCVPVTLSVPGEVIASGQVRCNNATQTITVAGSGSVFQVQSGGSATFIAGQNIRYLPVTRVISGGYMHGYITTTGQYCIPLPPSNPLVAVDSSLQDGSTGLGDNPELPGSRFCFIYPNPTNGDFNLVLSTENRDWPVTVRIYNAYGALVKETMLVEGRSHLFSLREQKPGVYILHIGHGTTTEVEKVIRY
ncbi:MAG: PKD domain-containing protein [Bacteroidetes bacterium]|nr:PKD domain-containing protein [Bacteroidota bacterium]